MRTSGTGSIVADLEKGLDAKPETIVVSVEEIERLRKLENDLKHLIAMRKEVLKHIRNQIDIERDNGYFYGTNGVLELKEKVIQRRTEISTLEDLLED